jgi:hypothetical protein
MKDHRFINKAVRKQKSRSVPVLENKIHREIADYLNLVIKRPSRWWTIEVSNQSSGKAAMLRQMALKRKGVVTGTPDIQIMWRDSFYITKLIFLEVKIPGGKLTEKQESLHEELKEDGHWVSVVSSVEDVQNILKNLGVI